MFPLCTDVSGNFFLYAIKQAWSGHQLISALWGEVIHIYPVLGLCSSYSHSITQMFILMDWHRFPLNCTKDYIQHHVLFYFVLFLLLFFISAPCCCRQSSQTIPYRSLSSFIFKKFQRSHSTVHLKTVTQPSVFWLLFQMVRKFLLIINLNLFMGSICSSASIAL